MDKLSIYHRYSPGLNQHLAHSGVQVVRVGSRGGLLFHYYSLELNDAHVYEP